MKNVRMNNFYFYRMTSFKLKFSDKIVTLISNSQLFVCGGLASNKPIARYTHNLEIFALNELNLKIA